MAFTNRIRLPFKLHKPQFVEDAQRYTKANGETVTLSVSVAKVYEGLTDSIPEKLHERLKIALVHDSVQIEGDRYVGVITQEGDYQIEWQDFLDRPIAQGKFKARVTPFNATNSNCGTCEEYTQVVCVDDDAGILDEDTTYIIDVLANDNICCNPVTVTVVTFNSTYLTSCIVNSNNEIVIHTNASLPATTDVLLVTYRAQCANGQFDEANVIADLDGTAGPICNPPTGLFVQSLSDTAATLAWTQPSGATSYEWEVRLLSDNSLVQSGTSTTADNNAIITGLTASTGYRFYVRSNCGGGSFSSFVYIDFTTNPPSGSDSCGLYELFDNSIQFHHGSYIDCNGVEQNVLVPPLNSIQICALQYSPGNPVDITVEPQISVTYLGLC